MRDKTQGFLLMAISFLTMILYFWAIFLSPKDIRYLGWAIWEWALIIPVIIIVYLFLVVLAWIGWAMVTTPPPIPPPNRGKNDSEQGQKG
ncbi:MAG: hypothetical protein RMJ07_02515 [Nitrososphaerota archaeon]|nr:hypothetical protein [Nitrososphaerota archaeon]